LDVLGPYAGRQTVDRAVGELHARFEIIEGEYGQHRAENLFARDRHLGRHSIEHRRLDVVALAVGPDGFAAGDQRGALVYTLLDVREDGLLLLLGDEGAEARVLVQRIAGRELLRS